MGGGQEGPLTKKATVIVLPKGALVSFDRRETVDRDGNKLQRVYFLDRTSDGLTVGDKAYEIYYVTKRGKRPGSLIYGDEAIFPRTEIRERSLTAKDIRRYKADFKRRFRKVVRTARAHRPAAKKIPKFTSGTCGAYWSIIKNKRVVSKPILPVGKRVRFSHAVTLLTRVPENALKKPRVRYHADNPQAIDPKQCASLQAKTKIMLPGQKMPTTATVSAGGVARYPVWLRELFLTNYFKSHFPGYIAKIGVDYMFGGDHYIHLALNNPARLIAEK